MRPISLPTSKSNPRFLLSSSYKLLPSRRSPSMGFTCASSCAATARFASTQDADNATLHWDWNPVRRPKAVTGHGSAGRRPSLGLHWARECRPKAVTGHGSAGRRPSLACTGHGSARPKANTPVPVRHCLHPGCGGTCTVLACVSCRL